MSNLRNRFKKYRSDESGNATIEFVFLFPVFIFLFLMGFESGYYMVRNVMLERAVDVAVRDVRLGNGRVPEIAALKRRICQEAAVIPDCMRAVQIEMRPITIEPGGTHTVRGRVTCSNMAAPGDHDKDDVYDIGAVNSMMMVRVCALSSPMFPTTRLGVGMTKDTGGNLAIISTTAFVNEPGNRSMALSNNTGAGGSTGGGAQPGNGK